METKNINPVCPYCKSDDCIVERPFWDFNTRGGKYWHILSNGFCVSCGKNFDVVADVIFHNSKKVKQS